MLDQIVIKKYTSEMQASAGLGHGCKGIWAKKSHSLPSLRVPLHRNGVGGRGVAEAPKFTLCKSRNALICDQNKQSGIKASDASGYSWSTTKSIGRL